MSSSLKTEVADLRALLEKLEIKLADETRARAEAEQARAEADRAREIAEEKAALLMAENRRLALRLWGCKSEKLSSEDVR